MPLVAKTNVLNNVDGSSEVQIHGVKVMCGINGPIEAKPRQELPTTGYIEVNIKPDIGSSGTREKLMEDKIRSFLSNVVVLGNLYPRQLIQINLQILEKAQNSYAEAHYEEPLVELNSCINAVVLALIDAGISILKLFNSNLLVYTLDNQLVADATEEQVAKSKSKHLVVYSIKNNQVDELLLSENYGRFSEKKLFKVLDVAAQRAQELSEIIRATVAENVERKFAFASV